MTSEGKSAREVAERIIEQAGHDFTIRESWWNPKWWCEHIEQAIERESRLSIAAALERVIERLREVETPFTLDAKNDRVYLSVKETCQMLAHEFEKLTPERVAHARAEHDRAVREPLEDVLRRIVARYADGDTGAFDELHSPLAWAMMSDARAALVSATEARSTADEERMSNWKSLSFDQFAEVPWTREPIVMICHYCGKGPIEGEIWRSETLGGVTKLGHQKCFDSERQATSPEDSGGKR